MRKTRHRGKATALALIIGLTALVSGCASLEIRTRGISYNEAISDFGNQQILLNAVRASKRYPTYYSVVGKLSARESINGSIAGRFPFTVSKGEHIRLPNFNLDPTVSVSSGIQTFDINSLNTMEFQTPMFAEISPKLFADFVANDWPIDLLYNVMIHKVSVDNELQKRMIKDVDQKCERARASPPPMRILKGSAAFVAM
jgi:hypothetical protein